MQKYTQDYVLVHSILYSELLALGGDSLVATYSILKFRRNKNSKINKENGRNIYHTLREETKLSVSTLRKQVKELIKLGVCYFDNKGNFCFLGGKKLNKKYKNKRVLVGIGNFKQTKLYSFRVRVFRMEQIQKNVIDRRDKLNKVIGREAKGYRLTLREINLLKSLSDRYLDYASNKSSFEVKTVLSNQGFSKLKHGETKSKSSGNYWKKKLISAGIIKVKRRFQFIKKCKREEYLFLKRNVDRTFMFKNGKLFKELIPEFTTTEFNKPDTTIKKLDYLQFDFCFFLANRG